MSKTLVIAEKPSVAADIARALGGFTKHTDYFENDDFVVSSAVGHLLELVVPEQYEVKRGKWSFANLPVIPPHFDLNPIEKTSTRLKLLKKLIKRTLCLDTILLGYTTVILLRSRYSHHCLVVVCHHDSSSVSAKTWGLGTT